MFDTHKIWYNCDILRSYYDPSILGYVFTSIHISSELALEVTFDGSFLIWNSHNNFIFFNWIRSFLYFFLTFLSFSCLFLYSFGIYWIISMLKFFVIIKVFWLPSKYRFYGFSSEAQMEPSVEVCFFPKLHKPIILKFSYIGHEYH